MVSSSPFFALRCAFRSSSFSVTKVIASCLFSIKALNSLIFFSASWLSRSWYSCSFTIELYSLLFLTFFNFSSYFLSSSFAVSIVNFWSVIPCSFSWTSALTFSNFVFNPAISFSKSSTSKGSSPRRFLISSIRESISWRS